MGDENTPYEYIDDRGIKIADSQWTCPNCGDDGELMYNNGGLDRCASCFWVVDGRNNDYVLSDWPIKYRDAQRLLAALGEDWHGTPGNVGTILHGLFDTDRELETAWRLEIAGFEYPETDSTTKDSRLTDFS